MMTCTKLLMNDCNVFVCEFIELDSCLVGPRRYPDQWICLFLCPASDLVMIHPTTLYSILTTLVYMTMLTAPFFSICM